MVSAPRCRPGARGLLTLLLLLPLPGARGGCGATPRLKSAALSTEDAKKNYCPPGTTMSYVCRQGYEETELRPVITCLENFTWSEAPEFCRGKSCDVPKGPEYGRAVNTTNYLYGAKVNIICDDGFRLHGRPFIQCMLKGHQVEWSQLPTCQAITCSPPPNIINGMHNGSNVEIFDCNSLVTYKCDHNFSLTGEASIHCTTKDNINGVWNGPAPECKGICDSPPRLSFAELPGVVNNSYSVGTELKYSCRPGYVLDPGKSPVVTCLPNSTWSVDLEFCVGICDSPPQLSFAELPGVVNNSYPVGTQLKYSCRPGYVLGSGRSPVVTCLTNSTWSVDPEFCVGSPCKQLELENGRVHLTDLRFGATANFSCNEGYRLIGPNSAQCALVRNGVDWDKELPLCQAIPCLPPPDITNGSHTGLSVEEFVFGSAVTYKCDQGFSLTGEASIHCRTKDNVNGEWSGPAPECKVVITQDKPTTVPPEGAEVAGTSSVVITQDKPTTVPPEGTEVAGTASGPIIDTLIVIVIVIAVSIIVIIVIVIDNRIGICAALNKKWQKKKGSYNVNPDSTKHQITTEHDFHMNESKCNLIFKV